MNSTAWSTAASVGVMVALGALLRALSRRGKWPRLPEPDPEQADTRSDRLRYYLGNGLAVVVGTLFAAALWAIPPTMEDGVLFRFSAYDGVGRLIGPFFLVLGAGGLALPWIVMRLVAPGPLLHILTRSAMRQVQAPLDLLPLLRWLSGGVVAAAVLLHLAVRSEHTTFDENGVRWRTWPWQSDTVRTWSDVREVRIVASFEAMTGAIRQRPHLSLVFHDGECLRFGKQNDPKPGMVERAAAIAAERTGLDVQRIERE